MRALLVLLIGIVLGLPVATADAADAHVATMERGGTFFCPTSERSFERSYHDEDFGYQAYQNGTREETHCDVFSVPASGWVDVNGGRVASFTTYGGESSTDRSFEQGTWDSAYSRDDCDPDPDTATPCSGRARATYFAYDERTRSWTGVLVGDHTGSGVAVARCQGDHTSGSYEGTYEARRGERSWNGSEAHRSVVSEDRCAQGAELIVQGERVRPMIVLWECGTTIDSRWDEFHSSEGGSRSDSIAYDHSERDWCAARPSVDEGVEGTGTRADGTHARVDTWAGLDHKTHCTRTWGTERTCTYDNATAVVGSGGLTVLGEEHAIEEQQARAVSAQDIADVAQDRLVSLGVLEG